MIDIIHIYTFLNCFFMILVSKTTRELLLHWDSSDYGSPVSVSMDLRMPQFTIEEVIPTKCYERFHLGKVFIIQCSD